MINNNSYYYPSQTIKPSLRYPDNYNKSETLINHLQTNKQPVLHDNLKDNIFNEYIKEYSVTIDSIDRDIISYPNPFKFKTLLLNSTNKNNIKPIIHRSFKNVKYIKIDSIICPINYNISDKLDKDDDNYDEEYATQYLTDYENLKIKSEIYNGIYEARLDEYSKLFDINYYTKYKHEYLINHSNDEWLVELEDKTKKDNQFYDAEYDINSKLYNETKYNEEKDKLKDRYIYDDTQYNIMDKRFMILRMNNINTNVSYGTNEILNQTKIIFYPKKKYNKNYVICKPVNKNSNIIYVNNSNLMNLDNIEFELYDGEYNLIEFSHCDINEKDKLLPQCPLNANTQLLINMRVGVYENYLDTDINY